MIQLDQVNVNCGETFGQTTVSNANFRLTINWESIAIT